MAFYASKYILSHHIHLVTYCKCYDIKGPCLYVFFPVSLYVLWRFEAFTQKHPEG